MRELFEAVCGAPAAWVDLSGRGLIRATGGDRVRFLNGMLTNDLEALEAGHWCRALQLDRKGHLLTDLEVVALPEAILLDVAPGREAELHAVLEKHIIADDVSLESLAASWSALAIEGDAAAVGGPALSQGQCAWEGQTLWLAGAGLTPDARRVLGPAEAIDELKTALALPKLEAAAAEVLRIEALLPRCGTDTGERTFPQEARLEGAVSFSKGCYIGQEIVARIHSRGAVNRLLVRIAADSPLEALGP